jgi:hypothetical protein
MAAVMGTFGWLRSAETLSTLWGMALASVQGSSAEASASPVDAYLLEIYRQVAESTRPTAAPRYARLASFLAFVSLVTTAFAVLVSLPDDAGGLVIAELCLALAATGLMVSAAFYALEIRARRPFALQTHTDAGANATSSIYLASSGFFAFTVAIAVALLLVG